MLLSSNAKDGVEVLLLSNVLYYPFRSNNCMQRVAMRLCMATRATRVLKQQCCIFKRAENRVEGG